MKSDKISVTEQLKIQKNAKSQLLRLEQLFKDDSTKKKIDTFKDKFSICEIVYKTILKEYLKYKNNNNNRNSTITMSQVPSALSFAGYTFEYDLLKKIFGSENHVGKRSVKKIRDSLNHDLNENVIIELKKRYYELNCYMDSFLENITSSINEN